MPLERSIEDDEEYWTPATPDTATRRSSSLARVDEPPSPSEPPTSPRHDPRVVLQNLVTTWQQGGLQSHTSLREQFRSVVLSFLRWQARETMRADLHLLAADGDWLFAPWAMLNVPRSLLHDCLEAELSVSMVKWNSRNTRISMRRHIARVVLERWPVPQYSPQWTHTERLFSNEHAGLQDDDIIVLFFGLGALQRPRTFFANELWCKVTKDDFLERYSGILAEGAARQRPEPALPSQVVCCLRVDKSSPLRQYVVKPQPRDIFNCICAASLFVFTYYCHLANLPATRQQVPEAVRTPEPVHAGVEVR